MSVFDTEEFSDKPSREWLIENGFDEIDEELEYTKYVRISDRRFIFEPIYLEYRYQTGELLIYTRGFTRWKFESEVKTNFLDRDYIPNLKDSDIRFSGMRIKRGLYKSANGLLINAEVNGSFNIIRKEVGDVEIPTDRGFVFNPIRISF